MKRQIDFIKFRYIGYLIPILIIIPGMICAIVNGLRFDIDFKGGTTISTELNQNFDNKEVEFLIKEITKNSPLVQKVTGGNNSVSITTEVISEETSQEIITALKNKYTNMSEPSIKNVQPAYGKELVNSALLAIGVSVILLLLYIGIRFKALGFVPAITAILALVHDVLIILSVYAIFGLAINSTFVAVVLTIVGYSINDTIIIYDRIRENKKKLSLSKDMKETINVSINQTLKRTIFTSLTTVLAIFVVFVFAYFNNQQVLKEFSLPLIIGVITGTYSSTFIASSLWYSITSTVQKFKKKKV